MTPAPEGANLPPQDLDAEEAVLGAMMINDQAVLTASEIISDPGEFYREAHGTVYRAIIALLARSEPIDAVTVSDELERMGALEQVGGRGFIFGLSSSVAGAWSPDGPRRTATFPWIRNRPNRPQWRQSCCRADLSPVSRCGQRLHPN